MSYRMRTACSTHTFSEAHHYIIDIIHPDQSGEAGEFEVARITAKATECIQLRDFLLPLEAYGRHL